MFPCPWTDNESTLNDCEAESQFKVVCIELIPRHSAHPINLSARLLPQQEGCQSFPTLGNQKHGHGTLQISRPPKLNRMDPLLQDNSTLPGMADQVGREDGRGFGCPELQKEPNITPDQPRQEQNAKWLQQDEAQPGTGKIASKTS